MTPPVDSKGAKKFTCPRRNESFAYRDGEKDTDYWRKREGHLVCSYCGSIQPEALFKGIDDGSAVGTTDKSYKIYIDLPGDGKKRSRASANFPQRGYRKVPFKKEWRAPAEPTLTFHAKFYFQHFDAKDRKRFIKLMNDNKLKFSGGFGFYVMPYFVKDSAPRKANK